MFLCRILTLIDLVFATASKCTKHIYLHLFMCVISLIHSRSLVRSQCCCCCHCPMLAYKCIYMCFVNSLRGNSHPLFHYSQFHQIFLLFVFERHMSVQSAHMVQKCNFPNDFLTSTLAIQTRFQHVFVHAEFISRYNLSCLVSFWAHSDLFVQQSIQTNVYMPAFVYRSVCGIPRRPMATHHISRM